MMHDKMLIIYNNQCRPAGAVPEYSVDEFRNIVITAANQNGRIAAMFAVPSAEKQARLYALLAYDNDGFMGLLSTQVHAAYPSITNACPQAHLFEREIAEQAGIIPEGHPWLKPVRSHEDINFFAVAGREIHEVAVGPVHAGIIEPGHFRFQCNGEDVLHLEISLGYQHRGIEEHLINGPNKRSVHYAETLAGDTTIGHATAYCNILETLSNTHVPMRGQVLRAIAVEFERLANHTGDLGALSGDVGYLPTASFCGRLRGDFLNMTAILCGNRFGRGFIIPGGTAYDIEQRHIDELRDKLNKVLKDVSNAVECLWQSPSVLNRFEETGTLSRKQATELGLVGVAARACELERDCRYNFASGIYQFSQVPLSTWHSGDVFARAYVRWLEIQRSAAFIESQLETIASGDAAVQSGAPASGSIAVALVEGWRGEICHVAITDASGKFARYKIVDPSFHNWTGLAMAMRNQQVSDFPLCNKSFNLSYCGYDL